MNTPYPWWHESADGGSVSVALIQFDLVDHTAWSAAQEESGSRIQAYESRKRLAVNLRSAVEGYGAHLHHWAGDGGLFASRCVDPGDADRACQAMAQMYLAFTQWRQENDTTMSFSCRITGTLIPDVCVDREAGNWYSSQLNSFLKYEREIGVDKAICITNELRRMLGKQGARFEGPGRQVPLADGRTIAVFADKDHPIEVDESTESFRAWLQNSYGSLDVAPATVRLDGLPEDATQIGDAVVLAAARSLAGYRLISLDQRDEIRFIGDILGEEDRDNWCKKHAELDSRGIQGTRLRVHTFSPGPLDDPVVRVGWSRGEYKDSHAFHSIAAADPRVPKCYAADAMRVLQDGTTLPNTLSNHAIVVFGPPQDRHLLLCHRRKGDRPGTYTRNRWSVSYEEQYNPFKQTIGEEVLKRDASIQGSVERGVREEILGEQYPGTIKVSIHAFQLESMILNFGFVAVVEVPDTNFDELKRLWPGADDAVEHDAIVALPLRAELLRQCLMSPRLPESIFDKLQTSRGFDALRVDDHAWHPTSPVRLALATWLSQQA